MIGISMKSVLVLEFTLYEETDMLYSKNR